ncbi:MAG: GNAT family N-acetyltransferase [Treponema sp.]|jgi:GNAT superfamily N-acetyltransferase|nr:GNAT family N-acetyltransferase [Treponema sp.]
MRFDLDKILTDEILFYMENQDGEFLLDTKSAKVIKTDNFDGKPDFEEEDRYIALPKWDTNNGFRLMEKFAVELRNPVVRHELSSALNVKKGVFRSFKNVLEQYPETGKMWYNFKKQKMKGKVLGWYNALREEWGLEPVGAEPEDISSIILEDFIFLEGEGNGGVEISALHKICLDELKEKGISVIFETGNDNLPDSVCIIAETSGGEFCGYIRAVENAPYLQITRLEVKPEYRGMGIGKTLLSKLLEKTAGQGIIFDLPAGCEYFSRALHLENFKPVMQRFVKKEEKE